MEQLTLLEPPQPDGSEPVWSVLDEEPRAEAVAALSRLIIKAATGQSAEDEERNDE